jgi:hypothetical protein
MNEQPATPPLPLPLLIIGLIATTGCAIWTGCLFYFYAGSIVYGVVAGICIGAAYAFAKQIKLRLYP